MRTARKRVMVGLCLLATSGCGGHGTPSGDAGQKSGSGGSSDVSSGGSSSGGAGGSSSGGSSGGAAGDSGASSGGSSSSSTGGSSSSANLPSDGNQLSVCAALTGECNKGYGCYLGEGSGRGFCSKLCTNDSDCDGLVPSGTKYVCGAGAGTRVCVIPCQNSMDTSTCPTGMICQQPGHDTAPSGGAIMMMPAGRGGDTMGAGGKAPGGGMGGTGKEAAGAGGAGGAQAGTGGGGGIGMPMTINTNARCKYPSGTSPLWAACGDVMHDCGDNLTCAGQDSSPSHVGYCTKTCTMDSDCDKPASGSIAPSCLALGEAAGRMPTLATRQCALDCSSAADGCPDGETCVKVMTAAGAVQRCEYK